MESGKWKIESGKWKIESGQLTIENGKCEVTFVIGNYRRKNLKENVLNYILDICPSLKSHLTHLKVILNS